MSIDVRGMAPLIQVFDMPTALGFYRDVLGFEIVASAGPSPNFGWVLLRLYGVEVMLNTAYEDDARPPEPDRARLEAHGDTCMFFGCPDVDAVYERLRAHGIEVPAPAMTGYGFRGLSVSDPDGYGLAFHWPARAATVAQWRDWYGFDPAAVEPRSDR